MNRTESKSFAWHLRRATDPARSAGTVMLLVVGVLLLVLIVGMTYMHVVQEDRRAGLTVDIDAIVLAQADLAATKLLEDLGVGPTGQHFADLHTNGTTDGTPDGSPDQEPYDYPGPVDKWLASTSPEATGTAWPQISLLGEGFWNGTNSSDTTQTLTATNAVGAAKASNGVADADGDGIMDSKPEQAAIFSRGGLLFFGWARVEDMSSKVNMNVWHSQVSNAGAYHATTNAPRWWYPGELDLGGWANSIKGVNAQYTNVMTADMPGLMGMRGVNTALPTPWGTAAGYRRHSWLLNAKFYENPQAPYAATNNLHLDSSGSFDPTNELELRHRNGLVYLDSEAPIEASGRARNLLRGNITSAETAWNDGIPGVSSIANYFTNEPRHQLTSYSGASIFRMPMGTDTATPFWGKRDINAILTGANPAANLSAEISRVFSVGTPQLPPSVTTAAELADQLAVNVIDYADEDNIVTVYNNRYGMEALPFLTEIYAQYEYEITAASGTAGNWSCTLAGAASPAYAIELRNPTKSPIQLTNVRVVVDGTVFGTLDTLAAGATGLPADSKLPPDRPLILFRDGVSANGTMSTFISTSQTPITKAITNVWPTHAAGSTEVTIELQVLASDSTWVTYQEFRQTKFNSSYVGPFTHNSATDPTGDHIYHQSFALGNGNGINMMTVDKSEVAYTKLSLATSVVTATDKLGLANKSNTSAPDLMTVTGNNLVIADRADLSGPSVSPITHIGELTHVALVGPTASKTVAEVIGTNTSMKSFTIKAIGLTVVATTDDYSVPYAVLLLARLTTLSPREDGVDNDGDGSATNAEEMFVPGTLNINTAPEFLMDRVLPIGSSSVRQAYVDAIIAYRDDVASARRATHRPGRKGIAYIGEVSNLEALANTIDFGANGVDDFNGATFGNVQGDFLANTLTGADGIIDDREEMTLIHRWLGQTCATRSDVYCAYILVRGYSPGNLTTPVTERRAAVLLDRSRVVDNDDGVRVLGVIWY